VQIHELENSLKLKHIPKNERPGHVNFNICIPFESPITFDYVSSVGHNEMNTNSDIG